MEDRVREVRSTVVMLLCWVLVVKQGSDDRITPSGCNKYKRVGFTVITHKNNEYK